MLFAQNETKRLQTVLLWGARLLHKSQIALIAAFFTLKNFPSILGLLNWKRPLFSDVFGVRFQKYQRQKIILWLNWDYAEFTADLFPRTVEPQGPTARQSPHK